MTDGASRRPPRPCPASPRRRVARWRRLGAPLGIALGALALGGCTVPTFGAFRGSTVQGHDEFKLWFGMAIAGLAVAVIVWGLIFWSVVAYRRRHDDEMPRQFREHLPLEVLYTVIPIVIVAVIFYFTFVTEDSIDAVAKKPAEIVHVLAYQWGWSFTYYDGSGHYQRVRIQTASQPQPTALPATSSEYPQMVLPLGETTRIVLNAADVIHALYVPAFNFNRQAIPGITNVFDFTPTQAGVFPGQCVQYCGLYHSEMLFSVRVVTPARFQRWLAAEQGAQASSQAAGGTA
ncbi:MAG TPA: cytochrome c oxidase subunit II [Acidimicrobiales bacterium]|nr:cytochrome c oxidase subunit II [Acidimicrobiales bacterium]